MDETLETAKLNLIYPSVLLWCNAALVEAVQIWPANHGGHTLHFSIQSLDCVCVSVLLDNPCSLFLRVLSARPLTIMWEEAVKGAQARARNSQPVCSRLETRVRLFMIMALTCRGQSGMRPIIRSMPTLICTLICTLVGPGVESGRWKEWKENRQNTTTDAVPSNYVHENYKQ